MFARGHLRHLFALWARWRPYAGEGGQSWGQSWGERAAGPLDADDATASRDAGHTRASHIGPQATWAPRARRGAGVGACLIF